MWARTRTPLRTKETVPYNGSDAQTLVACFCDRTIAAGNVTMRKALYEHIISDRDFSEGAGSPH